MTKEMLALAGLRIAVTRPQAQADALANSIEQLGGNAIRFPLLEISPPADTQTLQQVLARLPQFHIAIFISPNAVNYGLQAVQTAGQKFERQLIAAVGNGTAQALQAHGFKQVLAPQQRADSEALLELPALQQVADRHIVIFRGDHGRELLGDTLQSRGARVEYANCYQRGKPQQPLSLLLDAHPDILTVSSSEALDNLWQMATASEREKLKALPLFVLHERIALAARELGWHNITVTTGGDAGTVVALVNRAAQQRGRET
ncbi:MAG TPA: uroporphyrinogen-III synthase [Pseudomonadales bacterium]